MFATEVSSLIKSRAAARVCFCQTRRILNEEVQYCDLLASHACSLFNLLELLCQVESDSLIET